MQDQPQYIQFSMLRGNRKNSIIHGRVDQWDAVLASKLGGAGKTAVLVYTTPFWVPVFALWQMLIGSLSLALAALKFEHAPVHWTLEFCRAHGYTTIEQSAPDMILVSAIFAPIDGISHGHA